MNKSIVFVHGLGLGGWIFREHFAPYYETSGYNVHTFDLPAHTIGSPAASRQEVTLEACADYVVDYLQQNINTPYIIVGMSMGGGICQKLLERDRVVEDLRGVVLLSSIPPINNLLFTLRNCKRLALGNPNALVDFYTGTVNPSLVLSKTTMHEYSEEEILRYLQKVLSGFSRLEYEIFFTDTLKRRVRPSVPVKVIGGQDDLLLPPEVFEFTASYYETTADILPDLGHMIPVEPRYLSVLNSIDSFISEIF